MLLAWKSLYRYGTAWALPALASSACFVAGVALSVHHPLWPVAALGLFYGACIAFAGSPGLWLVAVPAGLPWLNFSPWTGWLVFEEFDLLLLAVFAGGYAGFAWRMYVPAAAAEHSVIVPAPLAHKISSRVFAGLLLGMGGFGTLALVLGVQDAGGFAFGWFDGYTDALNSLRVFKSLLFGLLAIPLLSEAMRESVNRASERLALGMGLGLTCVVIAVLWERAAFPGLFEFATVYRTTALFWEMHVGGGAIDAYLAMATPFCVLTLVRARRPAYRVASAILTLLTAYACLTTFSRGVYLAVVLPLLVFGGVILWRRIRLPSSDTGSLTRLAWLLVLAIGLLVVAALGPDTFLMNRLVQTDRVLQGRLSHWDAGIGLLQSRADWLLGIGLGRFPAHYDAKVVTEKFAGSAQVHGPEPGANSPRYFATLRGPASGAITGGLFALTQRVDLQPGANYRAAFDIRVASSATVVMELCERHLLYEKSCQGALLQVEPLQSPWQHRSFSLAGPVFQRSPWYAPRLGMLSISVVNEGGVADIGNLSLVGFGKNEALANRDFSAGMAHWFPAAQYYYLPWHTDSLYLEVLVERGVAGLVAFAGLVALALRRLLLAPGAGLWLAPYLAMSVGGVLSVGAVSSVMDVPRVAFMLYLLLFFAAQLPDQTEPSGGIDPKLPL